MSSSVCALCGATLEPSESFCGECGAAAASASTRQIIASSTGDAAVISRLTESPSLRDTHPRGGVAVGAAGPRDQTGAPAADEQPQMVAQYEKVLLEFGEDGVFEDWELEELATLRAELGISHATHDRLMAGIAVKAAPPMQIGFAIDLATIREFSVGHRGVARMRIDNLERRPLRNIRVGYGLQGRPGLMEHSERILPPNRSSEFNFHHQFDEAGHFVLSVGLQLESTAGELGFFLAENIPFKVGTTASGGGTQIVNIEAKVGSFDNLQLGNSGPQPLGGVLSEVNWSHVPLRFVSQVDFESWVARMEGHAERVGFQTQPPLSSQEGAPISAEGAATPLGGDWRSRLAELQWVGPSPKDVQPGVRTLRMQSGARQTELVVAPKDLLSFGRDPARADLRLAVEPFSPAEVYPDNVEKSRRISGRHFEVAVSETEAELTYVGSTPSTFLGATMLAAATPLLLSRNPQDVVFGRDQVFPNGALTLRFRVVTGKDFRVEAVWIERRNNLSERSYLQLIGAVGLRPENPGWASPPVNPPLFLLAAEGRVALINATAEAVYCEDVEVNPGCGVALRPRQRLAGPGWEIFID